MISFVYSYLKLAFNFQEIVRTHGHVLFSNKQIYPYVYCTSFVCSSVEKLHLSMIQNCFENIKPSKSLLGAKEKYLKSCK